jgi:hypothetical protein
MNDPDSERIADALVEQAAALFDVHDNLSRVIGNLNLPLDEFQDEYDILMNDSFDFAAMVRVYLYRQTADLSQNEVTDRIKHWKYLQTRFGLDRAPTQPALSYTEKRRFSRRLRSLLKNTAEGIREAASERGVQSKYLRQPDPDPDPAEIQETSTPLHHYVDNQAPGVITSALDEVCPALDTGRAENIKHEDEVVWEHQILMSLQDRSGTRAAYRTFNKFRKDALHHDTHLNAVNSLGTPSSYQYTFDDFKSGKPTPDWRHVADTIQPQFSAAVERQLDLIRPTDEFTEPVVAAIDVTGVPVHVTPWKGEDDIDPDDDRIVVDERTGETRVPKDDYPTMVNGAEKSGVYEYQYATLTIVGANTPLVIAVEPIRHHSTWEGDEGMSVSWAEVVDRLMEQATELVDIHMVMADKAFDQHGVCHVLDQRHDVTYLIPKKADSQHLRSQVAEVREDPDVTARVEQDAPLCLRNDTPYIDVDADPDVEADNYSHDVTFMHVPAERDDWIIRHADDTGYAIFVTNSDDVSPFDAEGLVNWYSKRWDIENEYRMILPLMPSIASTDYRMRFFAFTFSCLLYNLWRIVDHSLKVLASEKYDDYGRGSNEERLDTILPLSDLLASSIICLFSGLDPPDVAV